MSEPGTLFSLRRAFKVALVGNPNSGKTTVFNRLTGMAQRVGNYPGVTVERKVGRAVLGAHVVEVIDLPGTYSLAAHSPDEMVAVDVILGHLDGETAPDLVIDVIDASNLERNLYLFSQVRELGVPVIVALTMNDVAERRKIRVDAERLADELGVPVVPVRARRPEGADRLGQVVAETLDQLAPGTDQGRNDGAGEAVSDSRASPVSRDLHPALRCDDALHAQVERLHGEFAVAFREARGRDLHLFEVLRALVDRGGYTEIRLQRVLGADFSKRLEEYRQEVNGTAPLAVVESRLRYAWIRERIAVALEREEREGLSFSERLDGVLTHRVFGLVIFVVLMLVVFQSIFSWAAPVMDLVETTFTWLGAQVAAWLPEGLLRSLVVDGIIGGVGMVVIFLPQILILFFFIGLLEDCGYMARAAFLMDKLMSQCGLSGKSFIPMLSGFACAVPGVMAARVIEDRRDRLATILVTPLMSCSARLPIYAIFIGTFIPERSVLYGVLSLRAVTMLALYVLGILVAVAVAWTLRSTLLRGPRPPFVLELPSYKWPLLRLVALRLWGKARAFLLRAGTIILAVSVVVWALSYFPRSPDVLARHDQLRQQAALEMPAGPELDARLDEVQRLEDGELLRESYFGIMGRTIEPVFAPLGWDWRISMATLASFPAREVVVAVLGTVFNLGEVDEESVSLRQGLAAATRKEGGLLFSLPVALSILVFFALCCQCAATLATIKRETNSWRWPMFTFVYMTTLAYVGALLTYQIGTRL